MLVYVQVRKYVDMKKVFLISIKKWLAGFLMLLCIKASENILGASVKDLMFMVLEGGTIYFIALLILKDDFFLCKYEHYDKKDKTYFELKKLMKT